MTNPTCPAIEGCILYHAVWKIVAENFFDSSRLAQWASWEHRFDNLIASEADALPYIDQMLASLKDNYTERVIPQMVPDATANSGLESAQSDAGLAAVERPAAVMAVLRPDKIGYMQILNFDSEEIFTEIESAAAKIADCHAFILDLRSNSGGRMHRAIQAASLFVENGVVTTVEIRSGAGALTTRVYKLTAEEFFCVETLPDGQELTTGYERSRAIFAGKPGVVLLHRRTASAAEVLACALLENGSVGQLISMGGDTAGKGIGQAEFDVLDGKLSLKITRSRWLTPSGQWLGDCGQTVSDAIEPDIYVPADRGMEGLTMAIEHLREKLKSTV